MNDNNDSVVHAIRENSGTTRIIASAVIAFFAWGVVSPAAAAMKEEIKHPTKAKATKASYQPQVQQPQDSEQQYFEQLHEELAALQKTVKAGHDLVLKKKRKDKNGKTVTDISIIGTPDEAAAKVHQAKLGQLVLKLKEADVEVQKQFDTDAEHIKAHHLPQVIMDRHDKAEAEFQKRAKDVQDQLAKLQGDTNVASLYDGTDALLNQLQSWEPQKAKFDPNNLAFRTNAPKVRQPATSVDELRKVLSRPAPSPHNKTIAMAEAPLLDVKDRKQAVSATQLAEIDADQHGYPIDRGNTMVADLNGGSTSEPGDEYLAATEDVQITPDIQAKAAELHNNPVEIYNWVHNSVEWMPTYGLIQSAQTTLDKKAGNSFDTASLLIALLRSSGTKSRYVYGTVDIPVDKLQSWIGGTTDPDAAQNIMSQGGVPNIGLTKAGKTTAIRMETVWVEAWIAYPSRGTGSSGIKAWLPMDASFKANITSAGMDLISHLNFDKSAFLAQLEQGATINGPSGYVQHVNVDQGSNAVSTYGNTLADYVTNSTADYDYDQIYGTTSILETSLTQIASGTPYLVKAIGGRYAALPDQFQHKFHFAIYTSEQDYQLENPSLIYESKTASLGGKSLILNFAPTTPADAETLKSFLPAPHADGSPYTVEELPTSLPAYSINVTAQLKIADAVVASGGSYTLGTSLVSEGGFTEMSFQGWDLSKDTQIAGQRSAVGLSMQGISHVQIDSVRDRLDLTSQKLQAQDAAAASEDRIDNDLLTATIWNYFGTLESFGHIAQGAANQIDVPGLSFGYFHTQVIPRTQYGVVASVRYPGFLMDVGHVRRISFDKANDSSRWVNYNLTRGQHSSEMESSVPEEMLSSLSGGEAYGMSAAKALRIALQQGQKVFQVSSANSSVLANIHQSAAVMSNIRSALNAGKIVVVHEMPIDVDGFSGAGYVISDPLTGSGEYLIEGGAHGATVLGLFLAVLIPLTCVLLIGAVEEGNWNGASLLFADFYAFSHEVSKIGKDEHLSPEEKYHELKAAMFLTVCSMVITLSGLGLGEEEASIRYAIQWGEAFILEFHYAWG